MSQPGEKDLLDWAGVLQAKAPLEVAHGIVDSLICANTLRVQTQERESFAQNRLYDRLARENCAPSPGNLGPCQDRVLNFSDVLAEVDTHSLAPDDIFESQILHDLSQELERQRADNIIHHGADEPSRDAASEVFIAGMNKSAQLGISILCG